MEKSKPWTVCGRAIGTATGWDQDDTFIVTFYNLVAGPGYTGPVGNTVSFNFEKGLIENYDDVAGTVVQSVDLISAIKDCPPVEAEH
jgi:hypothetical protein